MKAARHILPGSVLGILGGGQLGRMFALSAAYMGYRVICYVPEKDSPASQVCWKTYNAPYEDAESLRKFASEVAVVTIEFENIPTSALEIVQEIAEVRPGPSVLHLTQHRLREKEFLAKNNYPIVPFFPVKTLEDLHQALTTLGFPAVLKTAGFGYDGKGQHLINAPEDAERIFAQLNGQDAVLEKYVQFEKELSVIGARSVSGDFVAYGPIENEHRNHILDISLAPARINWTLAEEAIDITRSIMETLDVIGLLCVEFFMTSDETLMINELAPRPHNSGHYSIEGCPTSQFEQQVRCITGLPLGSTETEKGVAMANLLGDLWQDGEPQWSSAAALPDIHLHLYGKQEPKPGRKMGHLTACSKWGDEALERAKNARDLLVRPKD